MTFSGSYADNGSEYISETLVSPKQLVQESSIKSDISRLTETKKLELQEKEKIQLSYFIGYGTSGNSQVGYGHLEHFEYISMEVLGASVEDKATESLTLSALEHVHKHGLVHRDITPAILYVP
ncbi:hypothetical protein Clacol_009560 [Clathrus columnatus]|uniref:Protein kinase domain-containing protein n=1 Tax=Clathrus columnatus TaxID=1419009 RepID=A0AAV5AKY4_9AGAM|nr:hypothetical protein Clacol_009560 [Clathrus columnatus]